MGFHLVDIRFWENLNIGLFPALDIDGDFHIKVVSKLLSSGNNLALKRLTVFYTVWTRLELAAV